MDGWMEMGDGDVDRLAESGGGGGGAARGADAGGGRWMGSVRALRLREMMELDGVHLWPWARQHVAAIYMLACLLAAAAAATASATCSPTTRECMERTRHLQDPISRDNTRYRKRLTKPIVLSLSLSLLSLSRSLVACRARLWDREYPVIQVTNPRENPLDPLSLRRRRPSTRSTARTRRATTTTTTQGHRRHLAFLGRARTLLSPPLRRPLVPC